MRAAVLVAWGVLAAFGQGARAEAPGFDYYLLALTWMPGWCLREGDGRGDARCAAGAGAGWTLHGLWPQFEAGWPEFCTTAARDPSRRETAAMADIMGSGGLAWHQWRKHGRCSGLEAADYFARAREAFGRFDLPELSAAPGRVPVPALAAALVAANPGLPPDGLVARCPGGELVEVRICLTADLEPRRCGDDVLARACRGSLRIAPPR